MAAAAGYAASHGSCGMPYTFAEKLFDKTQIGMRVIIGPNDAAPVDFTHPALFVPNAQAIAVAPARAETLAREAEDAARRPARPEKPPRPRPRSSTGHAGVTAQLERLKTRATPSLRLPTRRSLLPRPTRPRRAPRI